MHHLGPSHEHHGYLELSVALDAHAEAFVRSQDIETLLSRIRSLSGVIGSTKVHDLDGDGYRTMAEAICVEIGRIVQVRLPTGTTAYGELVSWITGAPRTHAVEIFTTNYDMLFEEAFERSRAPYFDGFAKNFNGMATPGRLERPTS